MIGSAWFAAGAMAGIAQAWSLSHSVRSTRGGPAGAGLRLLLVGGVLLAAANNGGLIAAAVGWGVAFSAMAAIMCRRKWT